MAISSFHQSTGLRLLWCVVLCIAASHAETSSFRIADTMWVASSHGAYMHMYVCLYVGMYELCMYGEIGAAQKVWGHSTLSAVVNSNLYMHIHAHTHTHMQIVRL